MKYSIYIDIMPRLKAGLQQYKSKHREQILDIIKENEFFKCLGEDEVIFNHVLM